MSQYSFPLLSEREISVSLGELGMTVGPDHFAKPTYELVQPVYENLVAVLMGLSREELQQPVFAALSSLEFPELHDESIPALAFISHLQRLLTASGIKDFSLKASGDDGLRNGFDLHKPDPQRLRRNLSAIINFAKFREEKLGIYAELQEQLQGLVAAQEQSESENARLHGELEALRAAAAAEAPEVARVTAEADAVYAENTDLNKRQAALSAEVKALKQGTNQLTDEAAALRLRLGSAHGEAELLRSQVVQSPQKLEAALEALAAALERERAAVADAERRQRELAGRADALARLEKDARKASALMGELEGEIARKKGVSREVKSLRASLAAREHEAEQQAATLAHLRRQAAALADRIARLEAQGEVKREAAEGNIEEQLRDREAYEAENAASVAKVAENEAAARALRARLADLLAAHEAQQAELLDKYTDLLRQVRAYHAELSQIMGGPEAARGAAPAALHVR